MGSANAPIGSSDAKSARIAETILAMFSPVPTNAKLPLLVGSADDRALWIADALHRANNLSQMSSALGSTSMRRRFGPSIDDYAVEARALSRAYAELGAPDLTNLTVPCAPLLEAIAARLVALFGDARSIRLHISAGEVTLLADQRRALTLIASELIINALKYAFATDTAGTISVELRQIDDIIELCVADNGRGLPAHQAHAGTGNSLMAKLTTMLGASMVWTNTKTGLTVTVTMPRRAT